MVFPITLTDEAADKAYDLLVREGREDLRLRVSVQAGGCAGLIYNLFFDSRFLDGDLIEDFGQVEAIVDSMSAPYLQGSVVDYQDTLEKSGFSLDNPNSSGSCACGDSFQ